MNDPARNQPTTTQANAPATQTAPPAQPRTFREMIASDGYKGQLAAALPKHITPDRMVRVVLTAINRTPKLLDCTKESLWQAVLDCSSLGLEPDALGRAYLVPYKDKCQLIVGYKGLIDLAYRSERVEAISSGVVREADRFTYELGLAPKLKHVPSGNPAKKITHVYAVARLRGAGVVFEVMTVDEVEKIRTRSKAGNDGPWVTDWSEMARKTVLRRLCKTLPMSSELAQALAHEAAHDDFDSAIPAEGRVVKDAPKEEAAAPTGGAA